MSYEISIERGDVNWFEVEPLYRQHYAEMQARLARDGIEISDYNPRLNRYFASFADGGLINYIVRFDGAVVGYSNVYITHDMHNCDMIAQEDTIYILPEHRKGIGKKLIKFALADLQARGVKRMVISPVTDTRVGKIFARMGFKTVAALMSYTFEG